MDNGLTAVNGQVLSAVTDINLSVLGLAPAMAMGSLYQSLSYATGMMVMNGVYAQQQTYLLHQTATAREIVRLFGR